MSVQLEQPERETFKQALQSLWMQVEGGDGLERIRQKAWQCFLSLDLPSKRHEAYRNIKLRHLFSHSLRQADLPVITRDQLLPWIYPECRDSVLVFVNGRYKPEWSSLEALPPKVEVSPLPEAMQTFGTLLHNYWMQSLKEETDPFVALNAALHTNGLFLYFPPKTVVEQPIQLLHLIDHGDQWPMLLPRLQLFVGAHADVRLIHVQRPLSATPYCVNQVVECVVDERASLHYTQVLCDEHPQAWHLDALRATLKRRSVLKTVCATTGSMGLRNDYKIALAGEEAEALLNGVWILREQRSAHIHVLMDHQAPACRSYQLFKGVLYDHSRSSFEGKIMVRQAAQKTDAFQLNNNLLLSDLARADSKPNLEIFADDVKASHGATIGQLDPEQLFYMKTRGCAEATAKNLLVEGFCAPILDIIPVSSLRREIGALALEPLPQESHDASISSSQ